jgi:hypothetical protein
MVGRVNHKKQKCGACFLCKNIHCNKIKFHDVTCISHIYIYIYIYMYVHIWTSFIEMEFHLFLFYMKNTKGYS